MQTLLRRMGNSTGMIVPKTLLSQLGVASGTRIDLRVESGSLIATPAAAGARAGWAEDAALIGQDALTEEEGAWLDFPNEGHVELTW